ncbi:GNAT family N-acetyltransferase [Polaribacter sp.]|nr:GNAT family N-acetyltransferase [Polaribacter sp.]
MKENIEIRRANSADATSIALLGRVTYTQSHGRYIENKKELFEFYNDAYSVSKIRDELKEAKNLYWIVFSDELPIGFAKLSLKNTPPNSQELNSCKLEKIYILDDFTGYKIGTKLQKILLKTAKQLHFKNIWLAVYYKNTKGINFYQKHGFKKTGDIDFVVGESVYRNLILLKKI